MQIYISASSREQFVNNQNSLTGNSDIVFNSLSNPFDERKTRTHEGHVYTKEGKQGVGIGVLRRITQLFVALSTSFVGFLSFRTLYRNEVFYHINKSAWLEMTTGKKWQSLYLRIEPPVVRETIRTVLERVEVPVTRTVIQYVQTPVDFATLDTEEKIHAFLLTANDSKIEEYVQWIKARWVAGAFNFGYVLKHIPNNQMYPFVRGIRGYHEMIKWSIEWLLKDESDQARRKLDSLFTLLNEDEKNVLSWETLILVLPITHYHWPQQFARQKQEAFTSTTFDPWKVLISLHKDEDIRAFCTFMPDKEKVWKVMTCDFPSAFCSTYRKAFNKGIFSAGIEKVDDIILEKYLEELLSKTKHPSQLLPTNDNTLKNEIEMIVEATKGANLDNLEFNSFLKLFMILNSQNINIFEVAKRSKKLDSFACEINDMINNDFVDIADRDERLEMITAVMEKAHQIINPLENSSLLFVFSSVHKNVVDDLISYQLTRGIYDYLPFYLEYDQYEPCLKTILESPHCLRNLQGFFEVLTTYSSTHAVFHNALIKSFKYVFDACKTETSKMNQIDHVWKTIFNEFRKQIEHGKNFSNMIPLIKKLLEIDTLNAKRFADLALSYGPIECILIQKTLDLKDLTERNGDLIELIDYRLWPAIFAALKTDRKKQIAFYKRMLKEYRDKLDYKNALNDDLMDAYRQMQKLRKVNKIPEEKNPDGSKDTTPLFSENNDDILEIRNA